MVRLKIPKFELADWVIGYRNVVKHDLSSSGIKPLNLKSMGIEIDYTLNIGGGGEDLLQILSEVYDMPIDNILVTTSGSEALFLAFGSLLNSGDEVIVHIPNYPPMFKLPLLFGAKVHLLQSKFENGFEPDPDILKEMVTYRTKPFVFTNSNNPTGRIMDKKLLKTIVEIAKDYRIRLIVDETFREYAFEKAPPLVSHLSDSAISLNTMSKFYGMEDLRIRWMIADKKTIRRAKDLKNWTTVQNSHLSEKIAYNILSHREKLIHRAKEFYNRNLRLVENWIRRRKELKWVKPNAGLICFPHFDLPISSLQLGRILVKRYGVLIGPGTFFGLDRHFRLCFTKEPQEVAQALQALGSSLDRLDIQSR